MVSHFIKGTNKQYSIREDGTIIRYWYRHSSGTISYKQRIYKGFLNNKVDKISMVSINNKTYSIKYLMAFYFNIINPYGIDVPLIHKDNNILNCAASNLYYRKPKEKTPVEYYHQNSEKYKQTRINMPRCYIASTLNIFVNELSEELYNHHKKLILFKRQIAKKHNISIQSLK